MQHDHPLTLQHVLRRMRAMNGDEEVVTLTEDGPSARRTREVGERVDRLCHALTALGVKPGDRVATFVWNTQRHLELYLAVPCMGAVLHTLNIRLFPEQLHLHRRPRRGRAAVRRSRRCARSGQVAPASRRRPHRASSATSTRSCSPSSLRAASTTPSSTTAAPPASATRAARPATPRASCTRTARTSCTRSASAWPTASGFVAATACCRSCRCSTPTPGASRTRARRPAPTLVMPDRFLQAEPLAKAIETERVTVAGAVPTIWLDLLRYADENEPDLSSSLRIVVCGGAAVPESLMRAFEERHGMRIVQAWGMTETSPLASRHPPDGRGRRALRARRQGRPLPLVEARIVDDDGEEVPWDGESTGELEVRGPWIARAYYQRPDDRREVRRRLAAHRRRRLDRPRGSIQHHRPRQGRHQVRRRVDLLGRPRERADGAPVDPRGRRDRQARRALGRAPARLRRARGRRAAGRRRAPALPARARREVVGAGRFAFIDEVPKTRVGKFDKKVLRARLQEGELSGVTV